ncbi:hypothetical protein [Janthinobacterium sp. RB2R34]|uniref:hypothetical protein n=1 Tax=Janthinobacterium sp. RB2R34 TaxID=3424193 RepID=UPI003F2763C9
MGAFYAPVFRPNERQKMNQQWRALVVECLQEAMSRNPDRPVAGAPFSQLLKRRAEVEGLDFPPAPFKKFLPFVESFKDVVIVQTRPGQDALIVPSDRADLLSSPSDSRANRLRDDIFLALTSLGARSNADPFYLRESDEINWFGHGQARPQNALPFPKASFEQEIADRTAFIDSTEETLPHENKARLSAALQATSPLGAFSREIKNLQLSQAWHRFRMRAILTRLQRWASDSGLEWKSAWISENSATSEQVPAAEQIPVPQADVLAGAFGREFFTALAEVVSDDDLHRISIPLDLVAKAWRAKGL